MIKQILFWVIVSVCFLLCGCTTNNEKKVAQGSTGYPSGTMQIECVMVDDQLFQYSNEGWLTSIPEGYEKAGSVLEVDNDNYPTENFNAGRLSVGDEIYVMSDSEEMETIYVKYEDGTCAKFVSATIVP